MSWLDFLLPQNTGFSPQQMSELDRRGLLNAAATVANMSAPQANNYKAGPIQLITNGLNAYQQGAQSGADQYWNNQINQSKATAANLSNVADQQNLDWVRNNPISNFPYATGVPSPTTAPTLTDFYKAGDKPLNNPGNLRPVGASTGFRQFDSPEAGMDALSKDLTAKLSGNSPAMAGRQPTLRNIISVYSPPNENQTDALIQNAAKRTGLDPDAPLSVADLPKVQEAILIQEQGGTGQPQPTASPGNDNTRFANHLYQLAEMQMRTNRPGGDALLRVASMYDPNLRRVNSAGMPAVLQIADEMAAARASGNKQRMADIAAIGKFYDKGVLPGEDGNFTTAPGYADATGNIAGTKKEYEKRAETKVAAESDINKQLQDIQQFSSSVSRFKDALSKTSMTGQIAGRYGDVTSDAGRTDLISAQNELTLRAKSLLGMPSANFSDADRDFITAIAGGKFGSKEGLSRVAERLEQMAAEQAQQLVQRKNSITNPSAPASGGVKFLGFE